MKLITIEEAAKILGLSVRSVRRKINKKLLRTVKLSDKRRKYLIYSDVVAQAQKTITTVNLKNQQLKLEALEAELSLIKKRLGLTTIPRNIDELFNIINSISFIPPTNESIYTVCNYLLTTDFSSLVNYTKQHSIKELLPILKKFKLSCSDLVKPYVDQTIEKIGSVIIYTTKPGEDYPEFLKTDPLEWLLKHIPE